MIIARPLTQADFTGFGEVFERPADYRRLYVSEALANRRAAARASLSLLHMAPLMAPSLLATKMERHEFSSQTFVPLDVSRYVVIVAPKDTRGGPDHLQLKAFIVRGDQGITYAPDVWHHPMCVLDRPGQFAIFMWLEGGRGDEEFVDFAQPVTVTL